MWCAHKKKQGGGGSSLQQKYKPANNKGAVRTASVVSNGLALFTKFVVAKPLANRRLFLCTPHLNKVDISMSDGR